MEEAHSGRLAALFQNQGAKLETPGGVAGIRQVPAHGAAQSMRSELPSPTRRLDTALGKRVRPPPGRSGFAGSAVLGGR